MDLLNLWNLYNIYSSPSFPLQLQTLSDPSGEAVLVCWVLFFSVFPCQPLTCCTSHCYTPLAAIHVALERDDANTL